MKCVPEVIEIVPGAVLGGKSLSEFAPVQASASYHRFRHVPTCLTVSGFGVRVLGVRIVQEMMTRTRLEVAHRERVCV